MDAARIAAGGTHLDKEGNLCPFPVRRNLFHQTALGGSMAKQVPVKFEADDGTEFDTEEEAQRHDALRLALEELTAAECKAGNAISATVKTADGQDFKLFRHHEYYYLDTHTHWDTGMPVLGTVRFMFSDTVHVDYSDDRSVVLATYVRDPNRPAYGTEVRRVNHKISDLYLDRKKAERAVLDARKQWVQWQVNDFGEMAKRVLGEDSLKLDGLWKFLPEEKQ